MRPRVREILASDHDWWDVYRACRSTEREHRREAARLWPEWSQFVDCLTDTEAAWFGYRGIS